MAAGGGSPRCAFDMVLSSLALTLTRSELTSGSTLGLGEARGLGSDRRGEKSWVLLPLPNSVRGGCERVSNIGGGGEQWPAVWHVTDRDSVGAVPGCVGFCFCARERRYKNEQTLHTSERRADHQAMRHVSSR